MRLFLISNQLEPLTNSFIVYAHHVLKAINVDSKNAPKQLYLILSTEHPEWKLTERRVAKYLKRLLQSRHDPSHQEIDADLDEVSVYSEVYSVSSPTPGKSWNKDDKSPTKVPSEDEPPAISPPVEKSPTTASDTASVEASSKEKAIENTAAYEDDNKNVKVEKSLCCEGCVIS